MAAPQSHLSLLVLFSLVLVSAFAFFVGAMAFHFTILEFLVILFWGFGFDFVDHVIHPNPRIMFIGVLDIVRRIGGGLPDPRLDNKKPYLHGWPVLFFLSVSSVFLWFLGSRWWVPWFGYLPHIFIDHFQAGKAWKFWSFGREMRGGYPVKEKPEFVIVSGLSAGLCFFLSVSPSLTFILPFFLIAVLSRLSRTAASLTSAGLSSLAALFFFCRFVL